MVQKVERWTSSRNEKALSRWEIDVSGQSDLLQITERYVWMLSYPKSSLLFRSASLLSWWNTLRPSSRVVHKGNDNDKRCYIRSLHSHWGMWAPFSFRLTLTSNFNSDFTQKMVKNGQKGQKLSDFFLTCKLWPVAYSASVRPDTCVVCLECKQHF